MLLQKAATLYSALRLGFHLTLADVTVEEFKAIELIDLEIQRVKTGSPTPEAPRNWKTVD